MKKYYSIEHEKYLKNIKRKNRVVIFFQIFIIIVFLIIWELLAKYNFINTFLMSSPSRIFFTIIGLIDNKTFFTHTIITLYEVFISFIISTGVGFVISILLWRFNLLYRIIEPYLTILNSLPKVALGPLIIILVGANINSIICMGILISTFITIINMYNAFSSTNNNYITLMQSFGASQNQIFYKVILPSNYLSIISSLKINISMNLIGLLPPVGEKTFFNKCYSRY